MPYLIFTGLLAIAIGFISATVQAQTMETITVIGSRTERPLKEIAATIDVIDAARIEEELARDISDLVRFEPGVTVSGTGSRYGLSQVSISGALEETES